MASTERLITNVRHADIKYTILSFAGLGLLLAKDIDGVRNILPEPFDIFDHIGNVNLSAQIGYLAGALTGVIYTRNKNKLHQVLSERKTRGVMAVGAAATGICINGLVETKTGQSLIHWQNTADPIDFIYGAITATAMGALLPIVKQKTISEYIELEALSQTDISLNANRLNQE